MNSLRLTPTPQGTLLAVKVHPQSRRTGVLGIHNGRLRVGVGAAAQKGQANRAAQRLLAQVLQVASSQVELVHGSASREKEFLVHGLSPQQVWQRVGPLLQRFSK